MKLIWGQMKQEGAAVIIEPEPNPADGIGSALVLMPWEKQEARIEAMLLERMGGTENWRGPWLLFGCLPEKVHPCSYLRLDERGFVEFGRVLGPEPEEQRIIATVPGQTTQFATETRGEMPIYLIALSYHADRVAIDGRDGHIGVFVTEQSSPFLGLYCEGSRIKWEVE